MQAAPSTPPGMTQQRKPHKDRDKDKDRGKGPKPRASRDSPLPAASEVAHQDSNMGFIVRIGSEAWHDQTVHRDTDKVRDRAKEEDMHQSNGAKALG